MNRIKEILLETWLIAALFALWWILSAGSNSPYFPPLKDIVATFADTWLFDHVMSDLVPSMVRFSVGLGIAIVVGILLGLVLGSSPRLGRAFGPILDFFRALPQPALIPIVIVFLGIGTSAKIFVIAFGAVWPILLNTIDGVRGVDKLLLDMARVYRLTRWERMRRIVLPAISPQVFVGVRLALAIALILMVISEMFASTNGLGYFILMSQQTFAIPEMWSGIVLLSLIGYLVNVLLLSVENRVLAWHRGWRGTVLDKDGQGSGKASKPRAGIAQILAPKMSSTQGGRNA